MEISISDCLDKYERTANGVGAYLKWFEEMLVYVEESATKAPLSTKERIKVWWLIKRMKALYKESSRDFTDLIKALGKLDIDDTVYFVQCCNSVDLMIKPLFTKVVFYFKQMNKVISLVNITTQSRS